MSDDAKPTPPVAPPLAYWEADPWWHVTAPFSNGSLQRSREALNQVLDQFEVERRLRYQPHRDAKGDVFTECNIFLNDVTRALGCEVAQREWGDRACGNCGHVERALVELSANGMIQWVAGPRGRANGWTECQQVTARMMADQGHPVAVTWLNLPGIGHVAVGAPAPKGAIDDGRLWIAQAGTRNFRCGPVAQGFGLRTVRFFSHA